MSKGFACDTDEMRALIARHEELRSDLERVIGLFAFWGVGGGVGMGSGPAR